MKFCWFTSFIGYPNFLKKQGRSYELGQAFITFVEAAKGGKTYSESKDLFPDLDHAQVETKKAAFQEFGLLYVVPRSNIITPTPLGNQVYDLVKDKQAREKNRRTLLLALSHGLSRYQFNNPLPVGGPPRIGRAQSSDVLPYLACYYLLLRLNGVLTVSELNGAVFGLQNMSDLRKLEAEIREHRKERSSFPRLEGLPANRGTADNLRIYFMAHLSIDWQILTATTADFYGIEEQSFELSQYGYEIIESIVSEQWPHWQSVSSNIPNAKDYANTGDYFENGVGAYCGTKTIQADVHKAEINTAKFSEGVLDTYDVENLKQLPRRNFREGKKRLVQHARLEKVRNSALVREAKRLFKKTHGRLFCEICDFDFENNYGKRGRDYIEAHHRTPISELEEDVELTVEDLAMVCSNCHRMLHRPPWIKVEELIQIILQTKLL
jgi:hypothetical protein